MGGGAHDFVGDQATQPAHSLGEEGRKLAGACSPCLRPHLAQSSGFRIESYIGQVLRPSWRSGATRRTQYPSLTPRTRPFPERRSSIACFALSLSGHPVLIDRALSRFVPCDSSGPGTLSDPEAPKHGDEPF